jgi:hypothetical protein
MTLAVLDTSEGKEIAIYASTLPPWGDWREAFRQIDPSVATNLSCSYRWLGKTLDAFFSDKPNPLPSSGLEEELQRVIQKESNFYVVLSLALFEAEPYLRDEANRAGLKFVEAMRRSDMVKIWMREMCAHLVYVYLQNLWEGTPPQHLKERRREYLKIFSGETSEEKFNILFARWEKEDSKLQRPEPLAFEEVFPWINFCLYVFVIYEKKIPSINTFWREMTSPTISHKFSIINKKYQKYRGRGKSKDRVKKNEEMS